MSDILQIKNFKGTNFEYGQWVEGFGNYVMGVDVFGLQDNTSQLSKPGVMQCMRTMAAGTEAAAPNDVTDLIRHFAFYPGGAGSVWGLSGEASPRLYERATGTWTLRRSTSGSDLTSASGGGGLVSFAGSLWTVQNSRVSRWDGTTWTQSFAALSSSASTPRPVKAFASVLMIGNGRYIDSISGTPTFNTASSSGSNTLTLPSEYTVTSMEIYRDRLYIAAENSSNGTASSTMSRIFIWDGISTTFETSFDLIDEALAPYLIFNQGVLWAIAVRGIGTPGTPIYIFNGSSFDKIMLLPLGVGTYRSCVSTYRGGILIGSTNSSSLSNFTNYPTSESGVGVGGIWMINRHNLNHPYQAILAYNPSNGVTQTTIGGIWSSGNTVYVGTQNNNSAAFEVWEAGTNVNNGGQWNSQPIDAEDASRNKAWESIQIDADAFPTGGTIAIGYRTNYATGAFTALKTVGSVSASTNNIPIGVTGRVIELQLQFNSNSNATSPKVHGLSLYYDVAGQ